VAGLCVRVADNAHKSHSIELPEGLGHPAFLFKFFLALITPSLKVVRVGAILDKSGWGRFATKHMLAYDGRCSFAMNSTVKHHWTRFRHLFPGLSKTPLPLNVDFDRLPPVGDGPQPTHCRPWRETD
jgi:hypothetical protein